MSRQDERNAYKREWYAKNKERLLAKSKKWVKDNPEKRKEISRKYKEANKEKALAYIINNFEWYMFNSARSRSRIHKIDFNLTVEDIVIPEYCPYLRVPLTKIMGQGRQDYNPSLDRIDPTKGYTKGNIQIISDKANRMKNNATKEELLQFAESILAKENL